MVDRFGLLTDEMPNLLDFQRKLAAKASRVTDAMLMAASQALADTSLLATTGQGPLLPQVNDIQKISRAIAVKVAKAAQKEGVAPLLSDEALEQALDDNWWQSAYRQYKYSSL
jgi:malate dehydrogenase (oxaloacetate-decarboxylating)